MKKELTTYLDSEQLPLKPLLDSLPCGIIIADTDGSICFWNDAATELFQYTHDEIIDKSIIVLMPERFIQAHSQALVKRKDNSAAPSHIIGNTIELAGRRKDGAEFPMQITITEHNVSGRMCYMAMIVELTNIQMMQMAKVMVMQLKKLNSKLPNEYGVTETVKE